jgi:YtcA family
MMRCAAVGVPILLVGCAPVGAPSLVLFGAYFPAWMFCAVLGIVAAVALRAVFVASGLAAVLPYQLFVCSAAGLMIAVVLELIWFGP